MTAVSVLNYGAKCDGVTNDTSSVVAAMASFGGRSGVVEFSGNMLIDPISVPGRVTLKGTAVGPFSIITASNRQNYPVLLVNSSASSFVTISGDAHLTDLAIFYPSQVTPSASTPIPYPPTVVLQATNGSGNTVERVTLINSYIGIVGCLSRGSIRNCLIGAFYAGIAIDHSEDFSLIQSVYHQVMWDVYAGLSYPQAIDAWVKSSSAALTIYRADAITVDDWGCFSVGVGITLADSPDTALAPRCGYGKFSNIEIDTALYGVNAISSNAAGRGYLFVGMNVNASLADMVLSTGGTQAPMISWIGGCSRGGGARTSLNSGSLKCLGVTGIS